MREANSNKTVRLLTYKLVGLIIEGMSNIKHIRERLDVTQAELAAAMGCTQGNVSFYEKGQGVPPEAARRLIAFAAERGLAITFDHVYGDARLDAAAAAKSEA